MVFGSGMRWCDGVYLCFFFYVLFCSHIACSSVEMRLFVQFISCSVKVQGCDIENQNYSRVEFQWESTHFGVALRRAALPPGKP